MEFSVLMTVYVKETPEHFRLAMDSIINQTVKPSEIVLVRDGLVTDELQACIDEYLAKEENITYIPLEVNSGSGNASRVGVEKAKHEIIARMDSDDISVPNRFELQLKAFENNPEIDVVGGTIAEFIDDVSNVICVRETALDDKEIKEYMKSRSAINNVSAMFKKSAIIKAGNYIELHFVEDYYMWCRMLACGCNFMNLPETLVYVRVGKDMYSRRGGYSYFKSLKELEKYKKHAGIISGFRYAKNVSVRFIQCVLLPNKLRGFLYKKLARKRAKNETN